MNEKIALLSLGCSKNRVDGEILLGTLKNAGYQIIENPVLSDVTIVNTCGFIEDAKKESIEETFNLIRNNVKNIVITGCLAERYKREIMKEIPEVSAVIGIGSNKDIVNIIKEVLSGNKVEKFEPKENLPLNGKRLQTTPKQYAYLKIAEGCDNRCSYCAIPLIRGRFRSRKMEDIISEAEKLSENGVKELLIIAQDTTRYGEDLYNKLALSDLLKELCKIKKIQWLRLLYCYPDRITNELIEVIKKEDKIVKYLDIPLQHCNKRILKLMNRRGNKSSLEKLLKTIKKEIPEITLRTTVMTGFPSETKEEFEELADFCNNIKFDRLGCFTYSKEEDTPAFNMKNQIDEQVKVRRQEIIMENQIKIIEQKNKNMINKKIKVLIESYNKNKNIYCGRSEKDAPEVDCYVYFNSNKKLKIGDFAIVKIKDYSNFDLVGDAI